jgi:hypothetical protein
MPPRKFLRHGAKLLAHDIVKHDLPGRVRGHSLDVDVPSPSLDQTGEPFGRRFDIDPVPALLIGQFCDSACFRIIDANVDLESAPPVAYLSVSDKRTFSWA